MMMPVLRAALRGLAFAGVVLLAACNGVGKGITPESSVLLPAGGAEGDTSMKAYTCLNSALTLIVEFSNGARGDFTSRAKWKSLNPAVVEVSNGEIAVPDQPGFLYGRGVLLFKKAGTAVITSEYLDFKNSITVMVDDPANFKITPAEANLAIGSGLDLGLTAELGGVTSSVDGFASWAFKDPAPAESVLTVNKATGTLSAPSPQPASFAPVSFRVAAKIPGCALKNQAGLDINGEISVPGGLDKLASLQLSKEFTASDKLVVNTTERYTATGTLANGKTQDLTGQAVFTALEYKEAVGVGGTVPADVPSKLATFLAGTTRNLLFATAVGTETGTDSVSLSKNQAHLRASFSFKELDASSVETTKTITTDVPDPDPSVVTPRAQIAVTPTAPALSSIAISSSSTKLAPGNSLKLKATGTFTNTDSSTLTQDISRHVAWEPRLSTETGGDTLTVQSSAGTSINVLAGLAVANAKAETGKVISVKASRAVSDTDTKVGMTSITIDPTEPQESP